MPEVQWYYARDEQQFGPVSASELKQLAEAGQISPDDLLWREGMDAWTTAINLRGLFAEDSGASATPDRAAAMPQPTIVDSALARLPRGSAPAAESDSLESVLALTQSGLWIMCVLVVLVGLALFTRAFLVAKAPAEEAAAGALFSTFFIAAYVLARAGEKLSRLLLARDHRRSP